MRAVVQRVLQGRAEVNKQTVGQISEGLLVYLSVGKKDDVSDAEFMADKLSNLRIFADDGGKMNRSMLDVGGAVLLVSNFTLHGDCRKGRRPSFDEAGEAEPAKKLYEKVGELLMQKGVRVEKGVFGEHMEISSINDGPVTFILDTEVT
ncbi:MAG: D-tyrosyl-tRNA(Tyr) deacylase [Sedimentisphaerales bacterium]|nr:D-tyrosyl-tRNA(Tyr) deacylase [Sedimentisphaerales bacterium]